MDWRTLTQITTNNSEDSDTVVAVCACVCVTEAQPVAEGQVCVTPALVRLLFCET